MQIVIDVPDDVYSAIVKQYRKDKELQTRDNLYKSIANGTPLPKGHGRLIDADMVCNELEGKSFNTSSDYHNAIDAVDDVPTIIEADKAERSE